MIIKAECLRPISAGRVHEFHTLKELWRLLANIRSLPREDIYRILYSMTTGEYDFAKERWWKRRERVVIYLASDIRERSLAEKVAAEVKRLNPKYSSPKKDKKTLLEESLAFAELFDKAIKEGTKKQETSAENSDEAMD